MSYYHAHLFISHLVRLFYLPYYYRLLSSKSLLFSVLYLRGERDHEVEFDRDHLAGDFHEELMSCCLDTNTHRCAEEALPQVVQVRERVFNTNPLQYFLSSPARPEE